MGEEIIHIVFAIHDSTGEYSRHTGAAITSIFCNTKSKIGIHLLHDSTLTDSNKLKFEELCMQYKQSIKFYHMKIPVELEKCRSIKSLSVASLYRLFIAEFLPIDKVIYLDSDIICNMDIKEIWSVPIDDFALGAIKDGVIYHLNREGYAKDPFFKKVSILNEKYFNAGILFLNLKKIRDQYDMLHDNVNFLMKYPEAPALDQDSLNFVFQNDCLYLDAKYNKSVRHSFDYEYENYNNRENWNDKIWHWYTKDKPWITNAYPVNVLYWIYLSKSPWGKNVENFIGYLQKSTIALEEGILTQPINSRKNFVRNFIKRLLKEIKLKMQGK